MSDDLSLLDDSDELLLQAIEESRRFYEEFEVPRQKNPSGQTTTCSNDGILYNGAEAPGFDMAAGQTWKYPINYPKRNYQHNIIKSALFKNTLVCLPTGMGKTFIAAVVMYNFYRWYPQGKIIFMAPTKPLVNQQIDACYKVTGMPIDDIIEMTGSMKAEVRLVEWQRKRVFFTTPHVVINDLENSLFPSKSIKCVVVDEAHRATGNYSYVQVMNYLFDNSAVFRVLALSATPGNNSAAVQEVLKNLRISHIETRTEESLDLVQYTNKRDIETVVVSLTGYLKIVIDKFMGVIDIFLRPLLQFKLLSGSVRSLSKFKILKIWNLIRSNPPSHLSPYQLATVHADFGVCVSLFHALELLTLSGLRSFVKFLTGVLEENKSQPVVKTRLTNCEPFMSLMEEVKGNIGQNPELMLSLRGPDQSFTSACTTSQMGSDFSSTSHPKFEKMQEVILEHFQTFQKQGIDTKVIVFCQYRDTVVETFNVLRKHQPLIKPMSFVGQAYAGKKSHGFTQKQQLKVMQKFRAGGYNTLISTCVGEEGLDIGEVDLIVCFDAHSSPIRLVQRMGRTGRKRKGKIIMLITEGHELQRYKRGLQQQQNVIKNVLEKNMFLYSNSPRMVPLGLIPECHEILITLVKDIPEEQNVKIKKKTANIKMLWEKAAKNLKVNAKTDSVSIQAEAVPDFNRIKEPAFLCSMHKDEMHDIFLHPSTQITGSSGASAFNFNPYRNFNLQAQKSFLLGHSSISMDFKDLCRLIETKKENLPQTQTAGLARKIDFDNLRSAGKKRKRLDNGKGAGEKAMKKQKKLQNFPIPPIFNVPEAMSSKKSDQDEAILKCNSEDRFSQDVLPVSLKPEKDGELIFEENKNTDFEFCNKWNIDVKNTISIFKEKNAISIFKEKYTTERCCFSASLIPCKEIHSVSMCYPENISVPSEILDIDKVLSSFTTENIQLAKCAVELINMSKSHLYSLCDSSDVLLNFCLYYSVEEFLSQISSEPELVQMDGDCVASMNYTSSKTDIVLKEGRRLPTVNKQSMESNCSLDICTLQLEKFSSEISPIREGMPNSKNVNMETHSNSVLHFISPVTSKAETAAEIDSSSPVVSQRTRRRPVCSTPKIEKRTLFKMSTDSLLLKNEEARQSASSKVVKLVEDSKTDNSFKNCDLKLKTGSNFNFSLISEEELFIDTDSDDDSAEINQTKKQSQIQKNHKSAGSDQSFHIKNNVQGEWRQDSNAAKIKLNKDADSQLVNLKNEYFERSLQNASIPADGLFEKMDTNLSHIQDCQGLYKSIDSVYIDKENKEKLIKDFDDEGLFVHQKHKGNGVKDSSLTFTDNNEKALECHASIGAVSKPVYVAGENKDSDSTFLDESYLYFNKKKKRIIIADSSHSDTAEKGKSSDSCGSTDVGIHLKAASSSLIESDDDFVPDWNKKKSKYLIKENETCEKKVKAVRKCSNKINEFIENEAEVSCERIPVSSDEDSSISAEEYDESFVNECPTQIDRSIDMHAKYLQSVRSPMQRRGQFKIPNVKYFHRSDVSGTSSDTEVEHNDSYMNDSFCVDDNEVIFTSEDDGLEGNNHVKATYSKSIPDKKSRCKKQNGWKRIVNYQDTESD